MVYSERFMKKFRGKKCEVCGREGEAHHFRHKGAGGADKEENIIVLCREHHCEIHKIGKWSFLDKYRWLKSRFNK